MMTTFPTLFQTLLRRRLLSAQISAVLVTTSLLIAACSGGHADARSNNVESSVRDTSPSAPPATAALSSGAAIPVRVYKDPSCGCCTAWVHHMRDNGFNVTTVDEPSQSAMDSIKRAHGVAQNNTSCHTAEVGRYVLEGHVPADLVQRLLKEKPTNVVGLAVPGMVTGSPGMEGPDPEHYTVFAMMRDGSTKPYAQR
ncbi:MAG: DUF411 domain-containing protein [Gemmatimonadaceae bacterium]